MKLSVGRQSIRRVIWWLLPEAEQRIVTKEKESSGDGRMNFVNYDPCPLNHEILSATRFVKGGA